MAFYLHFDGIRINWVTWTKWATKFNSMTEANLFAIQHDIDQFTVELVSE